MLLQKPEVVLSLPGLLGDIGYARSTVTEDMITLQGQILRELSALRRVQEELLEIEKQKLEIAKAKLELKKKEY